MLEQTARQLRPAVLEERADLIRFRVVENDRDPASMILLTGLKCLSVQVTSARPNELTHSRAHTRLSPAILFLSLL